MGILLLQIDLGKLKVQAFKPRKPRITVHPKAKSWEASVFFSMCHLLDSWGLLDYVKAGHLASYGQGASSCSSLFSLLSSSVPGI